jgi:hypothetical protein
MGNSIKIGPVIIMVYQLNWMLVVIFAAAAVLHIPHHVTGNLRGTPEGVCIYDYSISHTYLRGLENSTVQTMHFVESEDYLLYNNSDGYKYEFHALLRFE